MLSLSYHSVAGFVVTPSYSVPLAVRRSNVMVSADDEAKAAWLAKLDTDGWTAAARAMRKVATEAAELKELANHGDALTEEEAAKAAWLSKLDVPTWGKAAEAVEAMIAVEEEVDTEPLAAASALELSEEQAKQKWLAKLEVPTWGKLSEEQAKQKWLAKLDQPVWGQAAAAVISVVAEANKMADLTEDCNAGDEAACDMLSKEDEAKKAWLAKLDVPSWGKMTEEQAKMKWLAKLDNGKPSWQGKVAPTSQKDVQSPALFH